MGEAVGLGYNGLAEYESARIANYTPVAFPARTRRPAGVLVEYEMPPLKRCGHCGTEKPVEAFYRRRASRDGLMSWCRTCSDIGRRAREKTHYDAKWSVAGFWRRVKVSDSGCWDWQGVLTADGYGTIGTRRAHRIAYELLVGPIPAGLQIDHLCRNRRCVNPVHMEPVTNRENTMRGFSVAAVNARKTHCPHGHAYTPENTRVRWNGKIRRRVCVACVKVQNRRQPLAVV